MEREAKGWEDIQPPGGLGPRVLPLSSPWRLLPILGQPLDSEITRLESCLLHFLAVRSWSLQLTFVNFSFFLLKVDVAVSYFRS